MSVLITILRWLARLSGVVAACGFVALTFGDLLNPHSVGPSTLQEWAGITLLTATCAGMVLACRWEFQGAALSLTSLVVFTLIIRMGHHTVLFVLATPGMLFLADWFLRRRHASTPA
jgi:hypothetical protein